MNWQQTMERIFHGGIKGFNQKIFKYELLEDGIRFIYLSPDMEEGIREVFI